MHAFEELLDLIGAVAPVTAKGPDRRKLASLGPTSDRLRIHSKERGNFSRREERVISVRHLFPPFSVPLPAR